MHFVRVPYIIKKLYPKAIWSIPNSEKIIYLTFDDGPIPEITPWVLDVLKEKNVNATFFCVGENAKNNSDILHRIISEKHAIGNHTYNHLKGWNTHTLTYIKNTEKCAEIIKSNLFRPPYGRIKQNQYKLLSKKYKIIMWDVLSGDYDKKVSPEKCLENVVNNLRNGSIIVFHDSLKAKLNLQYALPKFIDYALSNNYHFEILQ
jgi:peptidoglycan/xylan/chitin deacetylase (PgdA/CDA1 family)